MSRSDATTTIQDLKDLVIKFRDERDWSKHHTPKNLAMSIAIEAAEIMEHFQWDELSSGDTDEVAAELADVLCYCLSLADRLDIDVSTALRQKMAHNVKKFPVELFNAGRDGQADFKRIKKAYRQAKRPKGTRS